MEALASGFPLSQSLSAEALGRAILLFFAFSISSFRVRFADKELHGGDRRHAVVVALKYFATDDGDVACMGGVFDPSFTVAWVTFTVRTVILVLQARRFCLGIQYYWRT